MVCIERTSPRNGIPEYPVWKIGHGFVLGNPKHGGVKHHKSNEVYANTLDEVAALIAKGFSVRMGRPGVRAFLVTPDSLRITCATFSN